MPKFSVFPESGVGVARKFQWRVERSSEEGARIEAPQASIGRVCEIGDTAVQEVYEQHIRGYTFCCKYASGNFLLPKTAKKKIFPHSRPNFYLASKSTHKQTETVPPTCGTDDGIDVVDTRSVSEPHSCRHQAGYARSHLHAA